MWMSSQRAQMDAGLLETQWRDHYSDEKQPGSRLIFQAPEKNNTKNQDPGINVYEEEEMLEDYIEDEVRRLVTSGPLI